MNTVTIKNLGSYKIKKGKKLLDFFTEKKLSINASCGGNGRCGLCRIRIPNETQKPAEIESLLIPEKFLKQGYRLACRYRIKKNIEITLPRSKTPKAANLKNSGFALDIGTTVIKGTSVNLKTGRIRGMAKVFNLQNGIGGDVITRISASINGKYDLLRNLLLASIEQVKKELGLQKPLFTTVVGNPVMLSFYLNKSVKGLAHYPFKSGLNNSTFLKKPLRFIFPIIGGFVGGDTIAGILASNIYKKRNPVLYIDLGTNGEVVLSSGDRIVAASTAAGPAFEGIGISCGCLAIPGAIDRITYNKGKFKYYTIRNKKPVGICASGLIDLLKLLLDNGMLREDGKLLQKTGIKKISINQDDIRTLQLAIGAIHAGIQILMKKAKVKAKHINEAIITGEFGSKLNPEALFRIGLLPQGIKIITFEKDLPLKGAISVLNNDKPFEELRIIKKKSKHITLATQPNFQKVFVSALKLAPWD